MLYLSSRITSMWREPMLKIGEFSKLSRVSIRMLRHYDEIGLLARRASTFSPATAITVRPSSSRPIGSPH